MLSNVESVAIFIHFCLEILEAVQNFHECSWVETLLLLLANFSIASSLLNVLWKIAAEPTIEKCCHCSRLWTLVQIFKKISLLSFSCSNFGGGLTFQNMFHCLQVLTLLLLFVKFSKVSSLPNLP